MSNQAAPGPNPKEIRHKLEELAGISKDLEGNIKMLASAPNFIAAEQLKKRVNELTLTQNRLMEDLVSKHPSQEKREEYAHLSRLVGELPAQIKACKEIDVLRQLEKEIEKTTDDLVYSFQTIVAELMGGPPPSSPVFD